MEGDCQRKTCGEHRGPRIESWACGEKKETKLRYMHGDTVACHETKEGLFFNHFIHPYINFPEDVGEGRQTEGRRAAKLGRVAERVRIGPRQHAGFCNEEVPCDCLESTHD